MTKRLEKKLMKKYPLILKDMYGDPKITSMAYGISCRDGWYFLLDTLLETIQDHIDYRSKIISLKVAESTEPFVMQVFARQIKEKYGELVVYYMGGDDYIRDLILYTRILSTKTCEVCGKFDKTVKKVTNKHIIETLCPQCNKEGKR